MADNEETKVEETESQEATEETQTEETEGAENEEKEEAQPKTYSEDYVRKLRDEAASWRTKLRETQEILDKAKSPEEYEALQNKLADFQKQYELDQVKAKATKSLPDELINSVTWPDSAEGIEAQAKALASFAESAGVARSTEELHGGLDPRSKRATPNESPEQLARRYNKRITH